MADKFTDGSMPLDRERMDAEQSLRTWHEQQLAQRSRETVRALGYWLRHESDCACREPFKHCTCGLHAAIRRLEAGQ